MPGAMVVVVEEWTLQCRHNGRDSVSNHRLLGCLFNRLLDQRKYQSSASLAFVRGIHRWPVNSPHEEPVLQKMFLFDDVTMETDGKRITSFGAQWFLKYRPNIWQWVLVITVILIGTRYKQQMALHFALSFQMNENILQINVSDPWYWNIASIKEQCKSSLPSMLIYGGASITDGKITISYPYDLSQILLYSLWTNILQR